MLHLVKGPQSTLARLRLDEALFRDPLKRTWLVYDDPSLLRNQLSIVLGISGKIPELVFETEARRDGVEIIRRFTGGGTVAVDDNSLLISLISNASSLSKHKASVKPFPRDIMQWSADRIYTPAFALSKTMPENSLSFRENDYVLGQHIKVAGNAQAISGDRFCHHTSFLWDVNETAMKYLKHPNRAPNYRAGRSHLEFLGGLRTYLRSKSDFVDAVVECVKEDLMIESVILDAPLLPFLEPSRNFIL